jgi:RNA polymerase sigma-70 factor, ECF subfamily
MLDTSDIVQVVVSKAVRQLARFDAQKRGALGFYLRQAVANEIASQWRRVDRTPIKTSLGDSLPDHEASPLDRLIGAERVKRYEAALLRLDDGDRNAIVGRFEFDYDYPQLARFLGRPSAEAARLAVHRAVKRLAEQARHV